MIANFRNMGDVGQSRPEIQVTPAAVESFRQALQAESMDDGNHAIRIGAERLGTGKLHHYLDFVGPGDRHEADLEIHEGGVSFVIDQVSARLLDGYELDFVKSLQGQGFKFNKPKKEFSDPVASRLQHFFETDITPALASHGGTIELIDYADGVAKVEMGGGCQGCGQAAATLRQGVETRVLQEFPEVKSIVDLTDHEAGENPYYAS